MFLRVRKQMDTRLKPKNDQLRLHIGIIAGFKPSKRAK